MIALQNSAVLILIKSTPDQKFGNLEPIFSIISHKWKNGAYKTVSYYQKLSLEMAAGKQVQLYSNRKPWKSDKLLFLAVFGYGNWLIEVLIEVI